MADSVSTEAAEAPFIGAGSTEVVQGIRDRAYWIAVSFMFLLVLAGTAAGIHAKLIGSLEAYGAYREVPWGILISTYVFFVVTSTGLCLVSSIGHVFGVKSLAPIAKRSVFLAVATIVAGFYVIFFEIENPFRMAIYNVISPNLTSSIWWMGTLYGSYMMFMVVEFYLLVKGNYKIATIAGFCGVIAGVAAHSNLGAVFGTLDGREFWYGPFMPIYFISSAMMSGAAAIIFFTWIASKINGEPIDQPTRKALEVTTRIGILLISVILFFTAWKFIIGFAGGEGKKMALDSLLTGPYAFNFWVLELGVGMIIPLMLLLKSRGTNISLMVVASMMMIFGIFFMRYDLVVVGQVVPVQFEMGVSEYPGLLSYMPSPHEILVVLGGIGLAGLVFLLGEKAFHGHKSEAH
ncbi:MAG: NrfD/PsrC family molybdoenzyme membrane anchor subunit [Thermoleophilia bacterium]|nr:NrfD/PsrC family molybdoenzyme membrane anchor subunit [Thermoleophilia bacterium]